MSTAILNRHWDYIDAREIERSLQLLRDNLKTGRRKTQCSDAHDAMDDCENSLNAIEAKLEMSAASLSIKFSLQDLYIYLDECWNLTADLAKPKNRASARALITEARQAAYAIENILNQRYLRSGE